MALLEVKNGEDKMDNFVIIIVSFLMAGFCIYLIEKLAILVTPKTKFIERNPKTGEFQISARDWTAIVDECSFR